MLRLKCSLQFSFLSNGVLLADSPIKFPALFISATSLARPSISLSFLLSLSHTHIPFKCKQTLFRAHSQSVHLTSSNTSYYETGFDWVEVSSSKNLLFSKWKLFCILAAIKNDYYYHFFKDVIAYFGYNRAVQNI